jgi:polyisoprenoid-binding protein YceI
MITMKHFFIAVLLIFSGHALSAQKFFTKAGLVRFESKTSLENIEAVNRSVTAVLDQSSGALQFSLNIRGFEFQKALMQEHFNENYMESDKFPKADFKGTIVQMPTTPGSYDVTAKGKLTIHGVTKDVSIPGKLIIEGENIKLKSAFPVSPADYNIEIPSLVRDKISRTLTVSVDCSLNPLK